jgi:hypothetical protein
MVIENSKAIYLFNRHQSLIWTLAENQKKKIRRKYKKRIQEDWYDYREDDIDGKIAEVDKEFAALTDLQMRIY